MGTDQSRHDLWAKRIHTWIGIVAGSIASVAAAYNFLPSFVRAAPGDIAAVVREQSGAPISRVHVELLTSQNILLGTSETDNNGRYVKKGLQPGSYILKVRRGSLEPRVTVVNVTSKNTTDLDLILKNRNHARAPTIPQATSTSLTQGNNIRSALEETGAAWVKSLANSAGKSRQ